MLAEADPTHGGHGKEFIARFEYAGEVAALGEGVDTWQVGDPVMGSIPSAFAEYVVADHRFVLPRPEGLAPEIACALPTGLLTEHGALTTAGFTAGQSVLITGASTSCSTTSPGKPSPSACPPPPRTVTWSTSGASTAPSRGSTSTICPTVTSPSTACHPGRRAW